MIQGLCYFIALGLASIGMSALVQHDYTLAGASAAGLLGCFGVYYRFLKGGA